MAIYTHLANPKCSFSFSHLLPQFQSHVTWWTKKHYSNSRAGSPLTLQNSYILGHQCVIRIDVVFDVNDIPLETYMSGTLILETCLVCKFWTFAIWSNCMVQYLQNWPHYPTWESFFSTQTSSMVAFQQTFQNLSRLENLYLDNNHLSGNVLLLSLPHWSLFQNLVYLGTSFLGGFPFFHWKHGVSH